MSGAAQMSIVPGDVVAAAATQCFSAVKFVRLMMVEVAVAMDHLL